MFEMIGASRHGMSIWWLGGTLLAQPWRSGASLTARAVRRFKPEGRRPRVSRLSDEWLRQHEIDSLKHRNDL